LFLALYDNFAVRFALKQAFDAALKLLFGGLVPAAQGRSRARRHQSP
jgi:hypothetical protein